MILNIPPGFQHIIYLPFRTTAGIYTIAQSLRVPKVNRNLLTWLCLQKSEKLKILLMFIIFYISDATLLTITVQGKQAEAELKCSAWTCLDFVS